MRRFTLPEYLRACAAAAAVAPAFLARPFRSARHYRAYQRARVARLLRHAWDHSVFYRRKYTDAGVTPADFRELDDLARFPTVTRRELLDAISAGELGPPPRHGIASVSSGSSGLGITITHDVRGTPPYAAGRYRNLNMTGALRPWSRILYVYTSEFPASSFLGMYRSWFVPTLCDLETTIATLQRVRPHVLSVYPSRLLEIAAGLDRARARGLCLQLISVNSETSSAAQRDAMAEHFGCPVLDEYSTEELGWTAAQCAEGTMHVWEDMAYLELLRPDADVRVPDGVEGEVVGTNLHNLATPCIRYRQGDSAVLSGDGCACGRTFRAIDRLRGRSNDAFQFSAARVSSAWLLDLMYRLLLTERYPIADYCLIQDARDSVRLEYAASPPHAATQALSARIEASLAALLPAGVAVHAVPTPAMHKTATGKRNPIVSLVGAA